MTAINPARLKAQAAEIAVLVKEPDQLISRVHELLSFYSSRIRQTSLAKTPLSLQTYQTPAPVLRALEIELNEQQEQGQAAGIILAEALWDEPWVEFRQLAVFVLGSLPAENADKILKRIKRWLDDCTAEDIRRLVMTQGMGNLATENPQACLKFIQELVESGTKADQQAALFGLGLFAADPDFLNLPPLYKTLDQILSSEESGLVKEITALLRLLIERYEQETAFFLEQQLSGKPQPRVLRVVRQVQKNFSRENQHLLHEKLGKTKSM
ncbi:MAG: DNA alkylation repair protein [Anaerolineales bacterium]